jgi:hypothetical protein
MKVTKISSTMKNFKRLTQMHCLYAAAGIDNSMTFTWGGREGLDSQKGQVIFPSVTRPD